MVRYEGYILVHAGKRYIGYITGCVHVSYLSYKEIYKKEYSLPNHWIGLENDFNNPQGKPLCFSWGKVKVLDSIDNDDYSDCMFGGMVFDTKNFYGVCDEEK